MKPDKIPEIVNMVDLTDEGTPKIKGDKPLTFNKSQLRERFRMTPGEVKFYRGDQRPEFKKSVIRKRECPLCGFTRNRLMAICPHCNNCMACGSYTGNQKDRNCKTCGNYDSGKTETVPTIIVN